MSYRIIKSDGTYAKLFINDSSKLGRGATADVYLSTLEGKNFAAKIYHNHKNYDTKKINAMLQNKPDFCEVIQNGQTYPQLAWPLFNILDSSNNPTGFLMPLVDTNESFSLDHYYDLSLLKKLNSPDEAALSYKIEIAKNLCELVAKLHHKGHYIIDFKPQNIRVFKKNHIVTLIDCDGFSFASNNNRFPAGLISTDYIAPEVQLNNTQPSALSEQQDLYALAVILFQLLNRGTHPFQGVLINKNIVINTNDNKAAQSLYPHGILNHPDIKPRPQSTHHLWPIETRTLFDQAFTFQSPNARPSALIWANHFAEILSSKTLVRCDQFPTNINHIRFRHMGCPACYLRKLTPFVPTQLKTRSNDPVSKSIKGSSRPSKTTPTIYDYIILLIILFSIFYQ